MRISTETIYRWVYAAAQFGDTSYRHLRRAHKRRRRQARYGRQLSERQANEMVAVLRIAGVKADKVAARDGKTFTVTTNPGDFSRAVEVLYDSGLSRDNFDTLGQVFKKEGFVSSPLEERARFTHALSQEISHTISSIDSVARQRRRQAGLRRCRRNAPSKIGRASCRERV